MAPLVRGCAGRAGSGNSVLHLPNPFFLLSLLDWLVLGGTLLFIVGYGTWRTRNAGSSLDGYLLGGRQANWWGIGLSIIATQASAITFLSTPGQAYADEIGRAHV